MANLANEFQLDVFLARSANDEMEVRSAAERLPHHNGLAHEVGRKAIGVASDGAN